MAAIREALQYLDVVIAEGGDLDALGFKSCFGILQLNQLPFAVRSPIGGTKNEENCSLGSFQ